MGANCPQCVVGDASFRSEDDIMASRMQNLIVPGFPDNAVGAHQRQSEQATISLPFPLGCVSEVAVSTGATPPSAGPSSRMNAQPTKQALCTAKDSSGSIRARSRAPSSVSSLKSISERSTSNTSPIYKVAHFPASGGVSSVAPSPSHRRRRHVGFAPSPSHSVHRSEHSIQPYSEIYGMHPTVFEFDAAGNKIPAKAKHAHAARDLCRPRLDLSRPAGAVCYN